MKQWRTRAGPANLGAERQIESSGVARPDEQGFASRGGGVTPEASPVVRIILKKYTGAYREIADMHAFDFGLDELPTFVRRMRGFEWKGWNRDTGMFQVLERAERDASSIFSRGRARP